MEFRVLGPLEVLGDGGEPLPLGGKRPRALFALLLLHRNEVGLDRPADRRRAGARIRLQASAARSRCTCTPSARRSAPTGSSRAPPAILRVEL